MEQEVFRENSKMTVQSKESQIYRQSKAEKNISEKFLTHYLEIIKDLSKKNLIRGIKMKSSLVKTAK